MKKSKSLLIGVAVVVILFALSLTFIIGADTSWGKVEVTHMVLITGDGDEISAMLYKPKTATPENPAPCAMITHGGSDMFEQMGAYALELARRGYVCITFDYTGSHNSDQMSGTAEGAGAISTYPANGFNTVWNTVQTFNYVDFNKIITMGHSMGGQYSHGFAVDHPGVVFLQVNIGMNAYGSPENQVHDFNFANVLGVADESTLARTDNNVASVFQAEQLRRIFFGDYTTVKEELPEIEIGKTYSVTGSNGRTYTRTAYMPDSCHAYYLVTNDAVQTVIYAVTSRVGIGLDPGINSYADHNKISTVWQMKDVGFFLQFATAAAVMFVLGSALLKTQIFGTLKLNNNEQSIAFPKKNPLYWVFFVVLLALPVALYRTGILAQRSFLGMNISKLWLVGGTNNSYISWQWTVALGMLAVFLIYHFVWGKKHGGNARTYGFATSNEKGFKIGYILKALAFGLITVGGAYIAFSLISSYTQQGIHIATFMMSPLKYTRTLCIPMYFLFQIPYFLTSSLATKSIGITETKDNGKGLLKSVGVGTLISVGGLFILWLVFIIPLMFGHYILGGSYFMLDRMYIYGIAILPLVIGMSIANAINIFVCKKTNSIWVGLFTALLWGAWIITSCGGLSRAIY